MAQLQGIAAVFPVSELPRAIEHYRALGFDVNEFDGDEAYAYAKRDEIRFHLWELPDVDPEHNFSSVFLFVDDADALAEQWRAALSGLEYDSPVNEPIDTDYGMREGAHVDPDGNLLRFGSRLAVS